MGERTEEMTMGKGDKKTEKGKRWRGSHGKSRPKNRHRPKPKKA